MSTRQLAPEASIDRMRERADEVVPSASLGVFTSTAAFLRSGTSGQWQTRITDDLAASYDERVAALVPVDLARWVHGGRHGSGIDPADSA